MLPSSPTMHRQLCSRLSSRRHVTPSRCCMRCACSRSSSCRMILSPCTCSVTRSSACRGQRRKRQRDESGGHVLKAGPSTTAVLPQILSIASRILAIPHIIQQPHRLACTNSKLLLAATSSSRKRSSRARSATSCSGALSSSCMPLISESSATGPKPRR